MVLRLLYGALLGIFMATADAGPVMEMTMTGQPQQSMTDGQLDGCGIRIIGIGDFTAQSRRVYIVDASFSFYLQGFGSIKGGLVETTGAAITSGKSLTSAIPVKTTDIWMKPPGRQITRPIRGAATPSPTSPGALIYPTPVEGVLALIEATLDGKPIQIGFKVPALDMDVVFFGIVKMSDAETAQFAECFSAVADAAKKSIDKKSSARPATK